ncbi:hypothetical protein [Achromobacter piechaudii]|uniref:Uncharacterized protein n=1 Tax=Achromobacter piechaudii TaxID=72556 RepID=A0ABM8KY69_9BURK|nr:hypothetical protein [Achromobacter piechaudii]CAB3705561.1 hypothetical protein LMG1873_02917 [Achromobacter piechaudii]CAB3846369.1 hypothetical protein LMG2828_01711 [Achromobacter piechaudii]CAB3959769.1 hypothetical protein LMG6103_05916 [Achromobacter piechaudii]
MRAAARRVFNARRMRENIRTSNGPPRIDPIPIQREACSKKIDTSLKMQRHPIRRARSPTAKRKPNGMSFFTHQERRAIQSGNVTEPRLATRSPLPMSARAARFHNLRKIRQPDQCAPVAAAAWRGRQARRTSATNQRISASRKPLLPRKKESSSRRHARIDALVYRAMPDASTLHAGGNHVHANTAQSGFGQHASTTIPRLAASNLSQAGNIVGVASVQTRSFFS